jgi:hypothetical protein
MFIFISRNRQKELRVSAVHSLRVSAAGFSGMRYASVYPIYETTDGAGSNI